MVREGLSEGQPCEFLREIRGNSECKGPEAGVGLLCLRDGRETSMIGERVSEGQEESMMS